MRFLGPERIETDVCNSDSNGRILKSDYLGRSLRVLPFRKPVKVLETGGLSVLSQLNVGESGVLVALDLPESVQNHLMHMGFVPDALVTVLRRAPAGDPVVYGVDGMEIALRRETSSAMRMRPATEEDLRLEDRQSEELQTAAKEAPPVLLEALR